MISPCSITTDTAKKVHPLLSHSSPSDFWKPFRNSLNPTNGLSLQVPQHWFNCGHITGSVLTTKFPDKTTTLMYQLQRSHTPDVRALSQHLIVTMQHSCCNIPEDRARESVIHPRSWPSQLEAKEFWGQSAQLPRIRMICEVFFCSWSFFVLECQMLFLRFILDPFVVHKGLSTVRIPINLSKRPEKNTSENTVETYWRTGLWKTKGSKNS